jgi:hypothetical protein
MHTKRRECLGTLLALVFLSACQEPSGSLVSREPRGWQPAVTIGTGGTVITDSYSGFYPPEVAIAVTLSGRALAAWAATEPTRILSSRTTADGIWSEPMEISEADVTLVGSPDLAVSPGGDAVAVWSEAVWGIDHSTWMVYGSRCAASSGWSRPVALEDRPSSVERLHGWRGRGGPVFAVLPKVAIDAAGNAVAVWNRTEATYDPIPIGNYEYKGIAAARSTVRGGWTRMPLVGPGGGGEPEVATGGDGTVFVGWGEFEGLLARSAWAAAFETRGGGLAEELDPGGGGAHVAADAAGHALALWSMGYPHRGVAASRRGLDGVWSPPVRFPGDWGSCPRVAMNAHGTAVATWHQAAPDHRDNALWVARFDPDHGWSEPEWLGISDLCSATADVDPLGNVVVAWNTSERGSIGSTESIWTQRFHVGQGWGRLHNLASIRDNRYSMDGSVAGGLSNAALAVDGSGGAWAVWSQYWGPPPNPQVTIWAARYRAEP